MAVLPLVIAPDPLLKQVSKPVETINQDILTLLDDMVDTMYHSAGVGLSAVQVGHLKRLVTVDVHWREGDDASKKAIKMINPEIIDDSEELNTHLEGCLSFPDQYEDVTRPKTVRVRYLDVEGNSQEIDADGLLATCIQHEIDHMDGVVFVDHISRMKRDMILRKLKKLKKQGAFDAHVHDEHCNH